MKTEFPRLSAHFIRLRADAASQFPAVMKFALVIDDRAGKASARARAWTPMEPPWEIAVASKLEHESDARIEGVLRHEFGHAVDLIGGSMLKKLGLNLLSLPEARADQIARFIWGDPVRYDGDEIQTTAEGWERPAHLPK